MLESDSFSMKPPHTTPSCCSVLRGKGRPGVNVTFYLLIFHRRGGKQGARLVWKKRKGGRKRERENEGGGVQGTEADNGQAGCFFFYYYYCVVVGLFCASESEKECVTQPPHLLLEQAL